MDNENYEETIENNQENNDLTSENNQENFVETENVISENKRFDPQGFNKKTITSGMSSNNNMFGMRFGNFNRGKVGILFLLSVVGIIIIMGIIVLIK